MVAGIGYRCRTAAGGGRRPKPHLGCSIRAAKETALEATLARIGPLASNSPGRQNTSTSWSTSLTTDVRYRGEYAYLDA
jgi:hypothetical protein